VPSNRLHHPKRAPFVAVLGLALATGCAEDLQRMLDQQKSEAYEASSAFEDGRVMRTPPLGTVPHNAGDTRPQAAPELTAQLLDRGEDRYRVFCQPCHGALGDGRTEVARSMTLRKPPSLHEPRLMRLVPADLFQVVTEGYGLMPSYAAQLAPNDRWAVVAYVRALQLSQSVELSALTPPIREESSRWLR
jgi:mono/diheme cytochrome c family protein